MTENEAIQALKLEGGIEITGNGKRVADFITGLDIAIGALKEIKQYREIGTVEECREAVEKQRPKKCDVTKDNFRIFYKCPTCNHCLRVEYNHGSWMGKKSKNCSKCGQAIQWEESEEE